MAMVGDGANDSFALKAADAGLSINAHMAMAGGSSGGVDHDHETVDADDR